MLWITLIILTVCFITYSKCENCAVPFVANGQIGSFEIVDARTQFKEHEEGTRIEDGSYLYLRCNKKYVPFGTRNREEKVICNGGEWDRKPRCDPASCRDPPPQVTNAHQLTTNTSHGAKMLYYCIKDFRKTQFEDIKCNFGAWTGTPPACKDTRCDADSVAFSGVKKESGKRYYKLFESYTPICEEGYSAVTPNNRLICLNEEWNGPLPPCKLATVRKREEDSVVTTVKIPVDASNNVAHTPTARPVTASSQPTTKRPLNPDPPVDKDDCSVQNIRNGKLMTRIPTSRCDIFGRNCKNLVEFIEVKSHQTFSMGSSLNLTCDPGYSVRGRDGTHVVVRCFRGQWIPTPDCLRNRWKFLEHRATPRPTENPSTQAPKQPPPGFVRECPKYVEKPMDCSDIHRSGRNESGVYNIWPRNRILNKKSLAVYCDMDTEGGGWTVIQRRGNFSTPKDYFYKDWDSYKRGFGNITEEFWLGNDNIFAISNQAPYKIRFDLKNAEGKPGYAEYSTFWIEDEAANYTLHIEGYKGNVGDSMEYHNNKKFSTKDRDNDAWDEKSCAVARQGAWWYENCVYANLNGLNLPGEVSANGIIWDHWTYWMGLSGVEIKLRS